MSHPPRNVWIVELPTVSISELSRNPREVLRRVASGERLLVSRHGRPLATLQPLDGYVFQPFAGTGHDVFGWPIGGVDEELAKLTELQRALLKYGYRDWRLRWTRVPEDIEGSRVGAIEDLIVRGLVRKTPRGCELTSRGLAMHEALQRRRA